MMDEDLKQRLVGAVVITSLAAIFIPMLFDDPVDERGKIVTELTIPEMPVTLVRSGLSQLPKSRKDVINLPEPQIIKQLQNKENLVPKKLRWYVKIGTFSQERNAITLQNKIRKQGFPVSIKTVSTDKGTLYRVKVGPELSEKRVQEIKLKLEKVNDIKGIISSGGF